MEMRDIPPSRRLVIDGDPYWLDHVNGRTARSLVIAGLLSSLLVSDLRSGWITRRPSRAGQLIH